MSDNESGRDFIRTRIADDLASGSLEGGVVTRFPPEPNGYLHIGHAKSICLNFGVAQEFGGVTYLRFDDTNPLKEDVSYVQAIEADVRWLGFDFGERATFASDYFDHLYRFAVELIEGGHAYVCSLGPEEIRASRGTLTQPGTDSPYRGRSVDENLALFAAMRTGEFDDGEHVLRAKIDMASPNINLRDPVFYRIRNVAHQRTGDAWHIYPTYDFTHCICDALEGITHSLCTLEFEDHRPLYDWVINNISVNHHPPQIEFSRLGLEYTVMSKRLLHSLVDDGHVAGWDDPRMPTLAGLRRLGVRPEALREFCSRVGVTKSDNTVEYELLEFCVRSDLEDNAPRGMAVLDPIKVTITNFVGDDEILSAAWHPKQPELGERQLKFGKDLYIERDDFALDPPPKFKRLTKGGLVRLRYGYIVRCDDVVTDDAGNVVELLCEYEPSSKSGEDTSGLKPKGVIHWVAASNASEQTIRLYERLFLQPKPDTSDLPASLNPDSLSEHRGLVEQAIIASGMRHFQFERQGYFALDPDGGFNRTVTLRDSWKGGKG